MSNNNFKITIGVKKYRISLSSSCLRQGHCLNDVELSFELEGDFIDAALKDDLSSTVNYDALCQRLNQELHTFYCHELAGITPRLISAMKEYSPLIKGGFLNLQCTIHGVFFNEKCLI